MHMHITLIAKEENMDLGGETRKEFEGEKKR